MHESFVLRRMTEDDLPVVLHNERAAYSHPWSEKHFRDCLRAPNESWVLVNDDRVIGHGIISVVLDEGHVLNLCIAPARQGEGLGRYLLDRLMARLWEKGASTIFLEVRASQVVAQSLYASAGFVEIGVRHGYYPATEGREDAIIMACQKVD
ncbi:ribosomal protein S18-alanine N-acetyltransferase [Hahella sp. SMD15-11]|uniref:[Ribosomal protein bS18]-alanine N-acetyltransferase n=1 Tax=Thermohahella caldifontis TaxID=3142973 RepID=A0AB39UW51_9GAMM